MVGVTGVSILLIGLPLVSHVVVYSQVIKATPIDPGESIDSCIGEQLVARKVFVVHGDRQSAKVHGVYEVQSLYQRQDDNLYLHLHKPFSEQQ